MKKCKKQHAWSFVFPWAQTLHFPEGSSVLEFTALSKQTGSLKSLDIVPVNAILQCQESQKQNVLLLQLSRR